MNISMIISKRTPTPETLKETGKVVLKKAAVPSWLIVGGLG
jgi:hypothetical protein